MKKSLKFIYISISFLLIFSLILNYFDWQFYAYLSKKTIAWLWIFCTILFVISFWRNKKVKLYFFSLIIGLILSIIPMAIPFFGIVYYLSTTDDFQQIQINETLRLETTKHSALSLPRVYIYKKHFGIFEKNICRPLFQNITDLNLEEEMEVENIKILSTKLISENKDSIGLEYEFKNSKKIVYHKLKHQDGY